MLIAMVISAMFFGAAFCHFLTKKQVQLVTSAQGSRGSGVVRATASIDGAGNVSIQSLDVDGSSVAGSVRGSGGGKNDVIIDV